MRLTFMGTPDFAAVSLQALADQHDIIAVYSQPPRPAGRGKAPRPSPVQKLAESLGIPVFTPETFKSDDVIAEFNALNADAAIVVAYGQILPQAALDAPKFGCLNIHASLLPRWRGAAPIQRAIMAGDAETGVCVMQMHAGLDTGPVCAQEAIKITDTDTAATLHDKLANIGAELICKSLNAIETGSAKFIEQDHDATTYAAKIDKAEARIDWQRPAVDICRDIRGLSPFPGAWCLADSDRIKILFAEPEETNSAKPAGTIIDNDLLVKAGTGSVRLIRLQRAGKGAMDAIDFQRGFPLEQNKNLT